MMHGLPLHRQEGRGANESRRGRTSRWIHSGYGYSKALRNSGLTWDEPTLDRWLTNPGTVVPGTRMFYEVQNPQDRADIIACLKQQK
jgi:cytochrome c2